MSKVGIVEGFFGPEWSADSRKGWAPFLKENHGQFYIYAPKRDGNLRKNWRNSWSDEYLNFLKDLCIHFKNHQISFGVGFSPFGLGTSIASADKDLIRKKALILKELGIDNVGIFFDDMPVTENLLQTQVEVINILKSIFTEGLIFCPSFYSYDPILDKVFGNRPQGYVEGLKHSIDPNIDICWTGPKVISDEIPNEHLKEVTTLLGRKPFLWENLYANDGPRNCKFLKLKFFEGRSDILENTQGVAFNLMNQSELSKILYLSSLKVMKGGELPERAFEQSCVECTGAALGKVIIQHRETFLMKGLDQIDEKEKESLINEFKKFDHACAREIVAYLCGEYLVGPECLTD